MEEDAEAESGGSKEIQTLIPKPKFDDESYKHDEKQSPRKIKLQRQEILKQVDISRDEIRIDSSKRDAKGEQELQSLS